MLWRYDVMMLWCVYIYGMQYQRAHQNSLERMLCLEHVYGINVHAVCCVLYAVPCAIDCMCIDKNGHRATNVFRDNIIGRFEIPINYGAVWCWIRVWSHCVRDWYVILSLSLSLWIACMCAWCVLIYIRIGYQSGNPDRRMNGAFMYPFFFAMYGLAVVTSLDLAGIDLCQLLGFASSGRFVNKLLGSL